MTAASNGAQTEQGRAVRRARRLPVPEDAEDSEDEGESVVQGGMERVRQLLQSVKTSVNKTFAKSHAAGILRAKFAGHHTDTPNDVQELINRYTQAQKVLMQIPAKRAEYTDGVESAVAAKGTFDTLLRELGETRSTYQLAEATTAVADTLLSIQDVQSRAEQGVIEFLFTMARQERKYTATVREQVNQLENLRASLDKVLTKQKTALEKGAPGSDPEKVERRKQKAAVRRLAFQDQVALLRKTVPETELRADAAYCEALVAMLREQRSSISGAAMLLSELDARMQNMETLAAETLSYLKSQEEQETRKRELEIAEACGPRIVEMLSAPDFAVAVAITQLCASPGDYIEQGEESLRSLLRLLDDSDLCVSLLKFSISLELLQEPPDATAAALFRLPSLAGALCSVALQMTGEGYLKASLTPLIVQIASGEADFEIDPRLLADDEDLEVNVDNLCKAVQWFLDTIVHSSRDTPVLLRTLCMHVYNIVGPKQRPLARCVAGALLMDAFICAALRDPVRSGLVETMPDGKSQRVLEHVARALSRTIYDGGGEAASPSVFAAATMSDFALDLPALPNELSAIIVDNRQRLMAPGGILDQLAGVSDVDDDDLPSTEVLMHTSSQELVEETSDVLVLRQLITSHYSMLSGILHQGGFHAQVAQLEACVQGWRVSDDDAPENAPRKLLPGSNQAAPVENNTWTETWKGPEDGWEEGEEQLDAGMLDGERLLGEVISTPHKAAGVGAVSGGSMSNDRRSLAQRLASPKHPDSLASQRKVGTRNRDRYPNVEVEDADSMPDSAPERPDEPASLPRLVLEVQKALTRNPVHSRATGAEIGVQIAAGDVHGGGAGGDLEQAGSEDEEGVRKLLKPRRKFTKTKALSMLLAASVDSQEDDDKRLAQSADTHSIAQGETAVGGELSADGAGKAASKTPGYTSGTEAWAADLGGVGALDEKFPAEFGAGQGWEEARTGGSKQPALRRTQRTVTMRGRREDDDEEDDQDGGAEGASARVTAAPATQNVNAAGPTESREHAEASTTERTEDAAYSDPPSTGVGRLFGVGAVFKRGADGFFYVKKVVNGGPADKAGVQVGSRVVSMDNERLYNKTAEQLFKTVLGSEGTTLKLALQPPGAVVRAPEQVVMVRRAFIDEGSLNATAIEPLPKSDASSVGVSAWALHQLVAATTGVVRSRAVAPADGVTGNAGHMGLDKVGVGVTFKKDGNGYYVVKRVSARGGAFGSGLAIGDCVISIDGHSMHRKSSQELSRSVLGPEGTSVTLLVRSQDGSTRNIEVRRLREQTGDDGDGASLDAGQGKDGDWEGGATGAQGEEWDGQGQVMSLEGNEAQGIVGIGATLVRDSRGLFVVAELSGAPQLSVGDMIVQVDGIQVRIPLAFISPAAPVWARPVCLVRGREC
jgi:C-terminal processing protease CtpA/Prc